MKDSQYITTKDYLVSGETFQLILDSERELLVTFPQPKTEELSKYYESENYISHNDSTKGVVSYIYQKVKKYAIKKKVSIVEKLQKSKGSILDIGAGTGEFLNEAKKNNWDIYGVEPNKGARDLAENKGLIIEDSLERLVGQKFDVITLWHVLEHLPNLNATIGKIESMLNDNGTLIIAVPNFNSFDAKFYKSYWAAYDVPRHLWHFSQASMKSLFSNKLNLVETKPLIFDSFYVSLLSEKYKSGSQLSIKAFFVGLWSNMCAWRTGEYSSLIYCYKKAH